MEAERVCMRVLVRHVVRVQFSCRCRVSSQDRGQTYMNYYTIIFYGCISIWYGRPQYTRIRIRSYCSHFIFIFFNEISIAHSYRKSVALAKCDEKKLFHLDWIITD